MITGYSHRVLLEMLSHLKIVPLLDNYEQEHGYEVIVTIVNMKYLKYYDTKVKLKYALFYLNIL